MSNVVPGLTLLTGALVMLGVCLIVAALTKRTPRLADALAGMFETATDPIDSGLTGSTSPSTRSTRLGLRLYRWTPVPLTDKQRQQLRLKNSTVAEFFSEKLVFAIIGAVLPAVVAAAVGFLSGGIGVTVPVLISLLGLLIGYFVPDLLLSGTAARRREDAAEALMTYIDLVTLERLANASASQALQNAARLSDIPVFTAIRAALERAQLEQRPPFDELRALGDRLDLPELTDLVDVMVLDEAGASLADLLRARTRELRDAHQATAQRQADAVSESLTVFMTIPALIFGLIFMIPPLLRLLSS